MRGARHRRCAAALGVLSLAGGLTLTLALGHPSPAHADDIGTQQQRISAALKAATADLDDANTSLVSAARELGEVQARLTSASAALAVDRRTLTAAQAPARSAAAEAATARLALAGAQTALLAADTAVTDQQAQIDTYARSIYEGGLPPSLDSVLAAGANPDGFLDRLSLIDAAAQGTHDQLVELAAARDAALAARLLVADRSATLTNRERQTAAAATAVSTAFDAQAAIEHQLDALVRSRSAVLHAAVVALAANRAQVNELTTESNQIAALLRARGSTGNLRVGKGGLLWPVNGPITSPFGWRKDPITGKYALHAGVDIGAATGTPIHVAATGTVIYAGWETGYGNYTCVDHGGGFSTCYAHQSRIEVRVGQHVLRGQVIGLVGMTGYATGPHLHFETRENGAPVNPLQFF